jgi:signal transduction histidine kinase
MGVNPPGPVCWEVRQGRHGVPTPSPCAHKPRRGEDDGKISGAVLLSYQVKLSYIDNSNNWWLTPLFIVILVSPFLYIVVFTLVFSRIFTNNINKPLQLLMDASRKIKEKKLDFEINYQSENELGRLCDAFSEMKEELKNSLSTQWEMEQDRIEMVESLAHDLKAPLSIIGSYSEALIDSNKNGDENLCKYLAVIKENAEKSSELVRQMQYTSDLERADIQLDLVPVNIASFIEQKVRHYELQAKQKEIEIVMQRETRERFLRETRGRFLCLNDNPGIINQGDKDGKTGQNQKQERNIPYNAEGK